MTGKGVVGQERRCASLCIWRTIVRHALARRQESHQLSLFLSGDDSHEPCPRISPDGFSISQLRPLRNHRYVQILPPPTVWIGTKAGHSKPQCFSDSRDSKNDSIFGGRREMQRRRRHAPSCMGATDGQRNWPEMLKNPGKTRVF